jgi:diguanylate cyclase (GGDEF)-like protein
MAEKMKVPAEQRQDIARGAMLHDIGKIGVPDAILHKTGQLSEAEWAIIRKHPEWGKQILEGIRFLEAPAEMVLSHHERWDGSGYPSGLSGEDIPLGARIFAVVDAFDAMTSYRPYRAPESYQKARAEIRAGRGTQFDPKVVDAFLEFSKEDWMLLREHEGAHPMEMGSLRRMGTGQLQSMNLIVSAITSSLDIHEILERTAKQITDVTRAASVAVFLLDPDEAMVFETGSHVPAEFGKQGQRSELARLLQAGENTRSHFFDDLAAEKGSWQRLAHKLQPSWTSAVQMPLMESERHAGWLLFFSKDGHIFEEDERLMFEQLAVQLGQALANARLHEQVRYQAITDGLTGAYNRRYLDDFLSIEVKRCQRYERPLAIIMLDLDHFRACNDRGGHQAGDKALRDTVQLLNIGVRSVDLVARYGGEEFLVALPETSAISAADVAERMRKLIEQHQFPCGQLTASFGVAASNFTSDDSPSVEELVARADKALYRAKKDGRNRVQIWNQELVEPWSK